MAADISPPHPHTLIGPMVPGELSPPPPNAHMVDSTEAESKEGAKKELGGKRGERDRNSQRYVEERQPPSAWGCCVWDPREGKCMQRMVLQAASQAGVEVSARQEQGGGDMSKSPGGAPGQSAERAG